MKVPLRVFRAGAQSVNCPFGHSVSRSISHMDSTGQPSSPGSSCRLSSTAWHMDRISESGGSISGIMTTGHPAAKAERTPLKLSSTTRHCAGGRDS